MGEVPLAVSNLEQLKVIDLNQNRCANHHRSCSPKYNIFMHWNTEEMCNTTPDCAVTYRHQQIALGSQIEAFDYAITFAALGQCINPRSCAVLVLQSEENSKPGVQGLHIFDRTLLA